MNNKFWSYAGGLIGGLALSKAPLADTFLSQIDPAIDFISVIAVVVFSGALVYEGAKTLLNK